jgi:two-component system cell cycle response regulator
VSETGSDATRPDTTILPAAVTVDRAVDPVSGLPDHRYFEIALGRHLAMARRGLRPLSLVLFELDGLENFAPYLRDHAMRVLTRTLGKTLRDSDTACRISDSVVGVILDDTPDAGAVWAAERIRGALFASPAGDILTLSAGVACYPAHALESDQLIDSAKRALEAARSNGRDRVEVASPTE